MARDRLQRGKLPRHLKRMVEVATAIGHEVRLTAVIRALQTPDGIAAGDAYPPGLPSSHRGRHIRRLRLLFDVRRPAKNVDSIYSVPLRVRLPLKEVVDALDRLTLAATTKRRPPAYVMVTVDDNGHFLVAGRTVTKDQLADAVEEELATARED